MEQTVRWHPAFLALRGASSVVRDSRLKSARRYKLSMSITKGTFRGPFRDRRYREKNQQQRRIPARPNRGSIVYR